MYLVFSKSFDFLEVAIELFNLGKPCSSQLLPGYWSLFIDADSLQFKTLFVIFQILFYEFLSGGGIAKFVQYVPALIIFV